MLDFTLVSLFIPTFFIVSITPGMCMTLAMVLGMSIGIRKTLWMMWGELIGVAIVAVSSVIGVSAIMLELPQIFDILKFIGAGYLFYIGINMWRSKGKLAISINNSSTVNTNKGSLFYQGFITAIANPKGWAFMISLLPPFINTQYALAPQLSVLITIILVSEFTCMMLYAAGGKTIGKVFTEQNNVKYLNRLSGTLMILVALWLAAS
ncbi:LysE family translocator [Colwellia sp. 4_MG-2023]|uniref:LysE family translocator n=1 Tax=unclassified Colwellia TaxID=196834 RepID=UPI001C09D45C|nr:MULTISPECIES: LysE family translocator [unclassified Colwellia]MBU2924372.1 LysE family translocator [Colwellia sp. C2M11]MDO6487234.1 LysE family translocator [Colwellia sp. 6_MG-2023]MDO6505403.1 LysE family translocator [Colwellia sp. 5_MG-2023]MDO6554301.1 LysE family translocator [Colwellia sp. 4_MG-2023]MDO6650826.1 LysE family translocator [Colwellia sp. 3_MG-2023]